MVMALLMIGVRSSRDPRGPLQNGFWGLKFILIFAGWIAALWIPHGSFGPVMMWFGMIGGMAFILVQLVLIVDFAHTWAESWQENYRSSSDQHWFWALLSSTVFFYICCLISIGLCFGYYTGLHTGDCRLHEFFISFNMILCLILSVTSVLPVIQEHQPNSGLLQASFVARVSLRRLTLGISFLTFISLKGSTLSREELTFANIDLWMSFGSFDSYMLG